MGNTEILGLRNISFKDKDKVDFSLSIDGNNLSLIAVIMKGETSAIRFAEAKTLLDYGFSNFEYYKYNNKYNI